MIRLRAPAKLNLYLRVVGKRPDGYHELETVFERIDLADELTFQPHPADVRLTCDDPTRSCSDDNLVLKAAKLLRDTSHVERGAMIHLTKRIPVAAGLGGGSSDAAATLRGLNHLWRLGLTTEQLMLLAAQLGSDVPVFLLDHPFAIGRGRGEQLTPLPTRRPLFHVLVVPPERLSTRAVFTSEGFDLTAPKPSITMMAHALSNGSFDELAPGLWNDLAPEAIRRCPIIALIQSRLRDLCPGVLMSGSGSSVFGLCRDAAHARAVAHAMRRDSPASWRIEIVHTDEGPAPSPADRQASVRHGIGE